MTSIDPLNQILASKIEGRTANVRYRQDQLQKLHNALLQNLDDIQGALHKDTGYTRAETVFEVATSLNAVRDHYASLNFDAAHNAEYRVANGQEASDRTVGCGIVYLEETSREFPFFGAIAPLAAALAAGCVVLIKIENSLQHYLPAVLRTCFAALDRETVVVTSSDIGDEAFLAQAVRVKQRSRLAGDRIERNIMGSPSSQRAIAVIDRTADLGAAAAAVVGARVSFRGRSPYAPDLVLVNEFVMDDFVDEVSRFMAPVSTTSVPIAEGKPRSGSETTALIRQLQKDPSVRIILDNAQGCVVKVSSSRSAALKHEVNEPVLVVAPMSSLTDALTSTTIAAAHSAAAFGECPYIASYIFAAPTSAKYLSQFIDAQASFINHIPRQLLVGPPAPVSLHHASSVRHRYEPAMFQLARPHYLDNRSCSKGSRRVGIASSAAVGSEDMRAAEQSLLEASKPLRPTGQALQMRGIGFFEQGILTGLSIAATLVLGTTGAAGYWLFTILRR